MKAPGSSRGFLFEQVRTPAFLFQPSGLTYRLAIVTDLVISTFATTN
jgi:hypothetical protein